MMMMMMMTTTTPTIYTNFSENRDSILSDLGSACHRGLLDSLHHGKVISPGCELRLIVDDDKHARARTHGDGKMNTCFVGLS